VRLPAPAFERKIRPPEDLASGIPGALRPLVFTNGVFDILHRGHAACLAQARSLGASLVVALNSDASVRRLGKGRNRPVNPLADRVAVIAALEAVDFVTWFEEDTPIALIETLRPDVLVKGGDWPLEKIVGAAAVIARGGRAVSIAFEHERSTSSLIERIRQAGQDVSCNPK